MSAALQIVHRATAYDIHFERTFDYELVRKVITHPKIWPHVTDDYSAPPDIWKPAETQLVWYVLAKDGDEILGVWTLIPENSVCWKIHTTLLPSAWGDRAKAAARSLAPWVWENTPCRRVITDVPENNRLALKFAKDAGMVEFGFNPASWLKNGQLWGQHMLGASKCQ